MEWAIVRGYEGCEMGHFVGGGEYIDPLRNRNVDCNSKLNNPELAYIALLIFGLHVKAQHKSLFCVGQTIIKPGQQSISSIHHHFSRLLLHLKHQQGHTTQWSCTRSTSAAISYNPHRHMKPRLLSSHEVRFKPSWTALRGILSVQHKKEERPCSTLILLGASSNRKCDLKCNVL